MPVLRQCDLEFLEVGDDPLTLMKQFAKTKTDLECCVPRAEEDGRGRVVEWPSIPLTFIIWQSLV